MRRGPSHAPTPAAHGTPSFTSNAALATYAWPYAKIGFYEPFIGLCQTCAVLWAIVYRQTHDPRWLLLAGFMAGWGVATKPSAVLLLPVLIGYVAYASFVTTPSVSYPMAAPRSGPRLGLPTDHNSSFPPHEPEPIPGSASPALR